MKTRRKNPAARRAPAELTETGADGVQVKLTAGALQGVLMEILAAVTAGLAATNECAMAAMPADMGEDARGNVRDAILLSGIATLVSIGRISADEERQHSGAEDQPARAALAAALLTAFSFNAAVNDTFIRSLTEACRPPLH